MMYYLKQIEGFFAYVVWPLKLNLVDLLYFIV